MYLSGSDRSRFNLIEVFVRKFIARVDAARPIISEGLVEVYFALQTGQFTSRDNLIVR